MENETFGIEDLQKDLQSYYKTVERLSKENSALRAEVAHLKDLLTATAPLLTKDVKIEVPKEQAACEIQLQMLHEKSKTRELTLEETKRLEILIKSLYLIKDKSTGITIDNSSSLSVDSLTEIASHGE